MDNLQTNVPELSTSQLSDFLKMYQDLKNTSDWQNSQDSREFFSDLITNSQLILDNSSIVNLQNENMALKEVNIE
jgi:uncharacterized membrane protein required for colicin V production